MDLLVLEKRLSRASRRPIVFVWLSRVTTLLVILLDSKLTGTMSQGGAGSSARHDSWNDKSIHTVRRFSISCCVVARVGSKRDAVFEGGWYNKSHVVELYQREQRTAKVLLLFLSWQLLVFYKF